MYHSSSNLSRTFRAVLTRAHAHTSCFFVRRSIARQVAEKIAQCNRALKLYRVKQLTATEAINYFNWNQSTMKTKARHKKRDQQAPTKLCINENITVKGLTDAVEQY